MFLIAAFLYKSTVTSSIVVQGDTLKLGSDKERSVPEPVERYDPPGIDYAWIMQVTFVVTIIIGAPIVAIASTQYSLPTWSDRAQFAIGLGAIVWFVVAVTVYGIARRRVN